MTQNFVRYSADVEQMEPNFEQSLQAVLDAMKHHIRGSLEAEGIGRVVRDAHAQGYGLARGEVEILSGLPGPYAQQPASRSQCRATAFPWSTLAFNKSDDRFRVNE
jgi:hypothetical protein